LKTEVFSLGATSAERCTERNPPTEPPCVGCITVLMKENEAAARIFMVSRGQVKTRFNGEYDVVTDLDFNALKVVMDIYQVRNQRETLSRVRGAFFHFLNKEKE
jgi:hypothetical protein